VTSAFPRF